MLPYVKVMQDVGCPERVRLQMHVSLAFFRIWILMRLDKVLDGTLSIVASTACFIYYYFIAFGANGRHLCAFRNFATTGRAFHKTTLETVNLVRLAT